MDIDIQKIEIDIRAEFPETKIMIRPHITEESMSNELLIANWNTDSEGKMPEKEAAQILKRVEELASITHNCKQI